MKKLLALLLVGVVYADNEVYVDQVGATFNLDIEQLGSSNIIGGLNSVAGSMTALDLDGGTMTLDINQIGIPINSLETSLLKTLRAYLNLMVAITTLQYR
jgi:hypothetical protein